MPFADLAQRLITPRVSRVALRTGSAAVELSAQQCTDRDDVPAAFTQRLHGAIEVTLATFSQKQLVSKSCTHYVPYVIVQQR